MSGRPAPPGRRGTVKKEAFKADDVSVEPVVLSAADRQKAEREAEMKQLMALRKKAQEEETEASQREQEVKKVSAAKQRAEELNKSKEKSKAVEEEARAAKAAAKAEEEARAAKAAAKAEEEERAAKAAAKAEEEARAAKAAAKAEEDARAAKAAAKAEEDARAAKAAAKAEEEARAAKAAAKAEEEARAAKAAAKAEKEAEEKEYEEEQARQQKAIEEQRRAREAEEAKRQAEQKEFLERQQQLEEQQRRMDEKLAQQKATLAESAANEERERVRLEQLKLVETQERDRQRAESLAAQQAAEQAEIVRLKEEEARKQEDLLESQRQEEAAHAEEVKRLEAERLAAVEEARKAEQAISEFENAALEEKKRRAEAQRKKREMFLNDMDSFSTTFEAKNQKEDEKIKAEQDKHYEVLAQQMKEVEAVKASVAAKEAAEKEQRAAALLAAAALAEQEAKAASDAAAKEATTVNNPPPAPVVAKKPADESASEGVRGKEVISGLSTSLFATSLAEKEIVGATSQTTLSPSSSLSAIAEESEDATEEAAACGTEELRVPTRIGSGKVKTKPLKPAPAAVIAERNQVAVAKYSEDEEEEGTGDLTSISNVLTLEERRKMTLQQKESWRAKQADLTEKRKDFHGVVTYTFDGVFSWQMYGSAEAVDESGANYTEYLMRCQWGTNFENMQPWIVAHRYKEFDQLDQALKRKFPRLEANMPKLPKKELFRSLNSEVVAERRAILEDYMSKVVVSMPSLMRSELMNDFLDITNRISGIRLMLLRESNKRIAAEARSESPTPVGKGPVVDPESLVSPISGTKSATAVPSNSKYGLEDPLLRHGAYSTSTPSSMKAMSAGPEMFRADSEEEEPIYWTMDDAEEARAAKACPSLDEDALGHVETDIRTLGQLLRKTDNKTLVAKESKFRSKFQSVSRRWPSLRATAVVGMGVDFTLIPRAMQAEEDLVRFVNEFRNIETAASISGRMVAV